MLNRKVFSDGLLIIFSVLFALFINKLYDDYKIRQSKKVAISSIHSELIRNQEIVESWYTNHQRIRNSISDLVRGQNDSLRQSLLRFSFLNFGVLTNNQGLTEDLLTNTAWESTKTTGLISQFDFDTTEKLTSVYTMQDLIVDRTLREIVTFYYDRDNHKIEELDAIMLQLMLRFYDLTSKEKILIDLYQETLNDLES